MLSIIAITVIMIMLFSALSDKLDEDSSVNQTDEKEITSNEISSIENKDEIPEELLECTAPLSEITNHTDSDINTYSKTSTSITAPLLENKEPPVVEPTLEIKNAKEINESELKTATKPEIVINNHEEHQATSNIPSSSIYSPYDSSLNSSSNTNNPYPYLDTFYSHYDSVDPYIVEFFEEQQNIAYDKKLFTLDILLNMRSYGMHLDNEHIIFPEYDCFNTRKKNNNKNFTGYCQVCLDTIHINISLQYVRCSSCGALHELIPVNPEDCDSGKILKHIDYFVD